MKKNKFSFFAIVLPLFVICGCNRFSPTLSPTTSSTNTTTIPITIVSPTLDISKTPAYVKISLEFPRNGKIYETTIDGNYKTINRVDIKWSGDIDKDGEIEYIVSLLDCGGANCLETPWINEVIQVHKYDLANDKYFVADKFMAKYPAVKTYTDTNKDGNPELITNNHGFCFMGCQPYGYSAVTVLQFKQGKFIDITKEFPDVIEQDSARLLEMAKASKYEGSFPLASYFYDMYRLGKATDAKKVVFEICEKTVKPIEGTPEFDCTKYLESIETEIRRYESKP